MSATSHAADVRVKRWAQRLGIDVEPGMVMHVVSEQFRMVWAHGEVATTAATAFAAMVAFFLQSRLDTTLVSIWIAVKVITALPRIVLSHVYRRGGWVADKRFRLRTYLLLFIDGSMWGICGAWAVQHDIQTASTVIACLCGVAGAATCGFQICRPATAAFVMPVLVPTITALLLRADDFGFALGSGLMLYLCVLISTAQRSEWRLTEVLLLRLHAAKVSAERAEALNIARRQSAVKSQFLGTVSHELRTPLHGILGLARLVHIDCEGDTNLRRRMELIEASGTHLLTLINDLLDISRIEARQIRLRPVTFDLASEVDRVADIYTVRAADKGLSFSVDARIPRPCWVQGDAARTRQVLHNLLGNAIKFTERGWIGLRVTRRDGDMFEFEVRDTGVGIDSSEQGAIFEAFHQTDRSTVSVQGTGLGLTIAREIARVLGGDIVVQSTPSVGSVFHFSARLPATSSPAPAGAPGVAPVTSSGQQPRILLAEDNDVNALIASSVLIHHGYDVEHVHDGREAVRRALREIDRPAMILMDCQMPVMDGFNATHQIRVQEGTLKLSRMPIIALTASHADDDEAQQCLASGMDEILTKPFTAEQLLAVVSRALDLGREWQAMPSQVLGSSGAQ